MPNLHIFGDSITWGACDLRGGGWAQRIRSEIDFAQTIDPTVWCCTFVLGIPGDTSAGLASRIESELRLRLLEEPGVAVIGIGINDSILHRGTPEKDISADQYAANLKRIHSVATECCKETYLLSLSPIDESKVNPTPWDAARGYTTARVAEFDSVLRNFAANVSVPLIDVRSALESRGGEVLYDGLHPNETGHALMYRAVRDSLAASPLLGKFFRLSGAEAAVRFGNPG